MSLCLLKPEYSVSPENNSKTRGSSRGRCPYWRLRSNILTRNCVRTKFVDDMEDGVAEAAHEDVEPGVVPCNVEA